jgi:sugar phosphate isomerase/epimerase
VNGERQPADFARILRILGKAGYRGYLALEYESTDNPRTAVPDLISKIRAAIAAYAD